MELETIIPLSTNMGGSFFIGLILGYFIKKLTKIIMFVLGGIVSLLLFLQYKDLILINYEKLDNYFMSLTFYFTDTFDFLTQSGPLTIPVTTSISSGFVIGFMKS